MSFKILKEIIFNKNHEMDQIEMLNVLVWMIWDIKSNKSQSKSLGTHLVSQPLSHPTNMLWSVYNKLSINDEPMWKWCCSYHKLTTQQGTTAHPLCDGYFTSINLYGV